MVLQHQTQTDKPVATEKHHHRTDETKREEAQQSKHNAQQPQASASPPSSSSSPSHEFSFTISLHPSAPPPSKSKPPPLTSAVDLSPADDIFFHGHLLPLHLLSHLPVSPRSSTNSLDSFTLPMKELSQNNNNNNDNKHEHYTNTNISPVRERNVLEGQGRGKSRSFSLFGWGKSGYEKKRQEGQKWKSKFDTSNFLQKYTRLIKPFIASFGNKRESCSRTHRDTTGYSFSGNLRFKSKLKGLRGRKDFSAPASMIHSPTNSGLLVGSGNITPTSNKSTSDSTMEELQAAIQAAIAHCKNSNIAADDNKIKLS